jgi:excisionase family DNA binding protein
MITATLSVREAATYSGLGRDKVYWHVSNDPTFPAFAVGKTGKKKRIVKELFDQWLINHGKKRTGLAK